MQNATHANKQRTDTASLLGEPQKLDNGFLRVPIRAARVGILVYHDELGQERKELVPPEELFNPASYGTILNKPVASEHPYPVTPDKEINSENFKKFGIGWTGNMAGPSEEFYLDVDSFIGDAAAIRKIEYERPQVSCGYRTDLIYDAGWWSDSQRKYVLEKDGFTEDGNGKTPPFSDGVHFDAIQTNRIYNHIAMCPKGRAGSECKFVLDSEDNLVPRIDTDLNIPVVKVGDKKQEDNMPKTITIEGKKHEVPEEVHEHIQKLKEEADRKDAKIDDLKAKAKARQADDDDDDDDDNDDDDDKAKGRRDKGKKKGDKGYPKGYGGDDDKMKKDLEEAKGKCDALQAKLDEATSPVKINELVKVRMAVVNAAINHLDAAAIEKLDTMTNLEIMKAVLLADEPGLKLDSAEEGYVKGRFEIVTRETSKKGDGGFGEKFMQARHDAAGMNPAAKGEEKRDKLRNRWKDPENPANKK